MDHILNSVKNRELSTSELCDRSIELAAELQKASLLSQTKEEKRQQLKIMRMIDDPMGKAFVTSLVDSCFRSPSTRPTADQIAYLIDWLGLPHFLSLLDQIAFRLFHSIGRRFHRQLVPIARRMIRREMRQVILPGESGPISHHIREKKREGVEINLNRLGEQLLGEEEAKRRIEHYKQDLREADIQTISVKISSISSHLNLVARKASLERLQVALRPLYQTALAEKKFINLDMEEYRDLTLTTELFTSLLDEPQFLHLSAGIALQAYLPDSFPILQQLTEWAVKRVDRGGAPIKVRIVKGANLAMERVESSIMGWPQAPYHSKFESDANFKRMVEWSCRPDHIRAVRIGIGSHNLFDIAYALILRTSRALGDGVIFEMLEGMAPGTSRAVCQAQGGLLLYSPVAEERDFQVATSYLIRRLDEQTAPENFLRHSFGLTVGSEDWNDQAGRFRRSAEQINSLSSSSRRTQNRMEPAEPLAFDAPFKNEPDTDWSLAHHALWVDQILKSAHGLYKTEIPLVLCGKEREGELLRGEGIDPSHPGAPFYHYARAGKREVELALDGAAKAAKGWGETSAIERALLLSKVAQKLREGRKELIAAMIADGGKIIAEGDREVSEAVDFAEYYSRSIQELHSLPNTVWSPKGPMVVASPWNFPCAIPTGGIAAALAAGNPVLFKPAPQTVLVGWILVQLFWAAGIPKEVLQFIPCPDEPSGSALVQDPRLKGVILTGATATASHLLAMRPNLDLFGETGGKNSFILSDLCDHDLAIRDLVQSAFGHAGQKCSAASLAICINRLYNDTRFLDRLRDATASLIVGSAWDPETQLPPLIAPPTGVLHRGLTHLDDGEEWLVRPEVSPDNPHLWRPGIKLGVQRGSFTHRTELFGPLLALMAARDIPTACHIANQTPYGLTAGIHSLDLREVESWKGQIEAGNLYINRTITGAIVGRQPFGGTKMSSFGGGLKTGGPSYLTQLQLAHTVGFPEEVANFSYRLHTLHTWINHSSLKEEEIALFEASVSSYGYWGGKLTLPIELSQRIGQDNIFYCLPHRFTLLRIQRGDCPLDIARIACAAILSGTHLEVSWDPADGLALPDNWPMSVSLHLESDQECAERIAQQHIRRVRTISSPSEVLLREGAKAGCYFCSAPVSANGRIELLHYMREVSISADYHRYGNLGMREG